MKGAGAAGSAPAIDHDHDKAKFSDILQAQGGAEGFGDKESLGPGIGLLDDGVFLRRVEIRGLPDQPVEISCAVRGFTLKWLGKFPAGVSDGGYVGFF